MDNQATIPYFAHEGEMAISIWIGAMVGYGKVTQLLEQITPKNK